MSVSSSSSCSMLTLCLKLKAIWEAAGEIFVLGVLKLGSAYHA